MSDEGREYFVGQRTFTVFRGGAVGPRVRERPMQVGRPLTAEDARKARLDVQQELYKRMVNEPAKPGQSLEERLAEIEAALARVGGGA
jgi:hypothetical protein